MPVYSRLFLICVFLFWQDIAVAVPALPEELDFAIQHSVQGHPDVMSAKYDSLSSSAELKSGEFRWYPQVFVNSSLGHRSATSAGGDNSKSFTFGVKQSVWDGGRVNSGYDILKANQLASISKEAYVKELMGIRVSDAYFGVLRAREALAVSQENIDSHQDLYDTISRRNVAGLSARSDVVLSMSRLQQAKSVIQLLYGQLGHANASYFSVVNEFPAKEMGGADAWSLEGDLQATIETARARSKVLAKLRYDLDGAKAAVESRRAELMPNLYASIDRTHYPQGGVYYPDDTRLMLNFEWQNDVALSKRYKVESAESKVMSAQASLDAADRQIVQTVSEYWEDLVAAQKRFDELKVYSASASEAVSMFRKQFTIGRRSWPDVLNSLQDAYSSKSQLVDAKYQVIIARFRLAFMVGEFDSYINSLEEDHRETSNVQEPDSHKIANSSEGKPELTLAHTLETQPTQTDDGVVTNIEVDKER